MDIAKIVSLTQSNLNKLKDGESIKTKDLVDLIVNETGSVPSLVRPIVTSVVAEMRDEFYVKKGVGGGIFRGQLEIKEDTRPRCPTCHQVIREKGKSGRKKKKKPEEASTEASAEERTHALALTAPQEVEEDEEDEEYEEDEEDEEDEEEEEENDEEEDQNA